MNKGLQLIVVVVSGAGAFYAAADWSRQHGALGALSAAGGSEIVLATPRATPRADAGAAPTETLSLAPGDRARAIPTSGGDAFGALSWLPPPPPAPPPAPPPPPPPAPAPTAPAPPFTFIGFVERGADRPRAYLTKGEALLIVGAGDLIDNSTYRVESLSPSGVVLTYLPLGTRQTVNVPGGTQ